MTHIEQAIKEAVEKGGYDPNFNIQMAITGHDPQFHSDLYRMAFLDPYFWQALGKARGWTSYYRVKKYKILDEYKEPWQYQWHKLIDHLARGKDAESFFKELV